MPISENLAKIAPAEDIRELPIAIFLADLTTRMNWDPDQFHLFRECGNLYIEVKAGCKKLRTGDCPPDYSYSFCLQDYSYGYQVKLVMDSIQASGLFD